MRFITIYLALAICSCGVTSINLQVKKRFNSRVVLARYFEGREYFGVWINKYTYGNINDGPVDTIHLLILNEPVMYSKIENMYIFKSKRKFVVIKMDNDSTIQNVYGPANLKKFEKFRTKLNLNDSINFELITE